MIEIYEANTEEEIPSYGTFRIMFKEISKLEMDYMWKYRLKGCEPTIVLFNSLKKKYGKVTKHISELILTKYVRTCYENE